MAKITAKTILTGTHLSAFGFKKTSGNYTGFIGITKVEFSYDDQTNEWQMSMDGVDGWCAFSTLSGFLRAIKDHSIEIGIKMKAKEIRKSLGIEPMD